MGKLVSIALVLVGYCIGILELWYCIGIVLLEKSQYCSALPTTDHAQAFLFVKFVSLLMSVEFIYLHAFVV